MTVTRMADPYASRVAPRPQIVPRRDPVLYGDKREGPLSSAQLAAYERKGFLFIDNFFAAEDAAGWAMELRRLWEMHAKGDAPEIIREPDSAEIRSIFAVHESSGAFAALTRQASLVAAVRQILGEGLYIHQSRVNYKPGFAGRQFDWHSDFETWHVEDGMPRMRALSVSIALTRNTPHNGPLMVIPGSHKHYVTCVGETPENHFETSLRKQEYGVPDEASLTRLVEQGGIEAATGDAGSVAFFDCNTMHGSNSNITPLPRSNVFLVFNSLDNKLTDPYTGQPARPRYIASRVFTPVD